MLTSALCDPHSRARIHSLVRHARAHVFVLDRARETDRVSPARREVREGEALSIAYVCPEWSREDRREILRAQYGFDCECARCTRELNATEAATARVDNESECTDATEATRSEETFEPFLPILHGRTGAEKFV